MVREQTMTRRGALRTIAGLTVAGSGISTATASSDAGEASSSNTQTEDVGKTDSQNRDTESPTRGRHTQLLTGVYDGTVDRIVDGEHVVILIEDSDRVIDQQVLDRTELPDIVEGAAVRVWIVNGTVRHVWEVT